MSIDAEFRKAAGLQKKGQVGQAAAIYEKILHRFPKNQRALEALRRLRTKRILSAISTKSLTAEHLQALIHLLEHRHLDDAAFAVDRLLKAFPNNPKLANIAGVVFSNRHEFERAVSCFRLAINLDPANPDTFSNLGNALLDTNQMDEAQVAFQRALEIDPENVFALSNYGRLLVTEHDLEKAEACFIKARSIDPSNIEVLNSLGSVLVDTDRFQESLLIFQEALKKDPNYWRLHKNMAVAMLRLDRKSESLAHYRKVEQLHPGLEDVRHMIAALGGERIDRASAAYVETLFDGFAGDFNTNLVDRLDYRLPEEVVELLTKTLGQTKVAKTLDLGCGTGLLAPHIRPLTDMLVGVDLSAKMIDHARRTKLYDQLVKTDAHEFLTACDMEFDLVLALDVLIYVGDVEELFEGLTGVCLPGARVILSTETFAGEGFALQQTGRYAHADSYLAACATQYGFIVEHHQPTDIRVERGQPVAGSIHSLVAPPR